MEVIYLLLQSALFLHIWESVYDYIWRAPDNWQGSQDTKGMSLGKVYAEYVSSEMLGWKNHKLESRLQGEVSTTSDTQMIPF